MLSERQGEILKIIIREYTQTAVPVSSTLLKEKYQPNYSSATIRNDMLRLEEEGFLLKPYVSAGRIPSDKGYRYFINNLMKERDLSPGYQKKLELEILKLKAKNARMERTTAKLLSSMSRCLAISGLIEKKEYYDFGIHNLLETPEFSNMDDLSKLTMALDLIDENVDKILEKIKGDETEIFVGKENPLKEIQNCSMVVSPYRLKSGERGLVAVIGPKRMKYDKNKGLVNFIKKILGSETVALLFMFSGLGWYMI
jgi:heat-inducible transcriptional repressor